MFEIISNRILIPALVATLLILVLYGVLFWMLGLERFDATNRSIETVRIIK
jgi:hypothetical protein